MLTNKNLDLGEVLTKDIQIARLHIETYDRETEEELKLWLSKLTQNLLAQESSEVLKA